MSRVPVKCCGQQPESDSVTYESTGQTMTIKYCQKCGWAIYPQDSEDGADKEWNDSMIKKNEALGVYQHSDMLLLGKVKKKRLIVKIALVLMVTGFACGVWFYLGKL